MVSLTVSVEAEVAGRGARLIAKFVIAILFLSPTACSYSSTMLLRPVLIAILASSGIIAKLFIAVPLLSSTACSNSSITRLGSALISSLPSSRMNDCQVDHCDTTDIAVLFPNRARAGELGSVQVGLRLLSQPQCTYIPAAILVFSMEGSIWNPRP